ncbi:phosphate:acyl-[acyl carrier protein] acyltransferase [Lachnospiraceae bacterium NE2001]|nr:phosphate:acyl-[acyl carrier protein] acyltransferase [Lachnospiraceae bacterium NE2001]
MSDMIRIVIDTIGGDNGAYVCVKGAIEGLKNHKDVKIFLTGHKSEIDLLLDEYEYDKDRIEVIDCTEEVTLNEPPVQAVREKKDSSLVVGLTLLKKGEADAFISAGSTGAILAGGQFVVGRAKGVKRTPLAHLLPTSSEPSLLLDCGANVDVKPDVLVQFAEMGSIYMEEVCGVKNPRVAVANVGLEEEKGNSLVKAAYSQLKTNTKVNFIGSIEARAIPYGKADVIVADGFVGNVIIKLYEGLSKMILRELKGAFLASFTSKLGAMLVKKSMKKTLLKFDASNKGGAPLLGLKGLVVKIHGNSKENEVISAVDQCVSFVRNDVSGKIIKGFEDSEE